MAKICEAKFNIMKTVKLKELEPSHRRLIREAWEARENAYCPYSNYKVGASLLTSGGNIYRGCNVESVTFTLTTHAEINAIDTMVASGENSISAFCVCVDDTSVWPPCGICRQKLIEFAENRGIPVLAANREEVRLYRLEELVPEFFFPEKF